MGKPGSCTCCPGSTLIAGAPESELIVTPPLGGGVMVTSSAAHVLVESIAASSKVFNAKRFFII
ncbi:MAG: hypothetical protein RSD57_15250 [Comamonas sp.]